MEQSNTLTARLNTYRNWQRLATEQTGKSAFQQIREIMALKNTGGQCGISDYYWYKLYDSDYLEGRGAEDFIGWRLQTQFSLALNPRSAVLPAWDKTVFTTLASSAGLPVAPIKATFKKSKKIAGCLGMHLSEISQAADFLRNSSVYPLFAKPAYSQQGVGGSYFEGYDATNDSLKQLGGSSIPLSTFLKRLETTIDHRYHKPEAGFIFQAPLKLAAEIETVTQWKAICSVRVICLNGPDGAKPIRAMWKVAVPPNYVDNFSYGKYGNLLASVDLNTGKVGRVLPGIWPETTLISTHPLTGHLITDFQLPGWSQILDICQRGGELFPLMHIHHWDFALTTDGPVILELNDIGSTEAAQIHGRGLLTEETRDFLKSFGNKGASPWIHSL